MVFRGQLFGLYRCDLDGSHSKILYNDRSGAASLSGNTVFYQHYDDTTALTFYKVDIDGKNNSIISDTPYSPTSIYNGKLYFSDPNGRHHILSMDTKTCQIVNYYDSNSYLTLIDNNYAYYIDLEIGRASCRERV